MMRWLILGVVLGLLLACPALLSAVLGLAAVLASQPVAVAFVLGLLTASRVRRWAS